MHISGIVKCQNCQSRGTNLLTNWFWYAVTAVNTHSGNMNVLNSSCSKSVMGALIAPSRRNTRCMRG